MFRSALIAVLLAVPAGNAVSLAQTAGTADVHVRVSPDVKTGMEGTTEFPTIQMALDHHPFPRAGSGGRVYLHIAPGIYRERVVVTQNHPGIVLLGMGKTPGDVVITGNLNAAGAGGTFVSQTVEVNGADFAADNLTIENTAGQTGPAVALAIRSDRAIVKHCRILGHQHTLFADYGRQYYLDSYIEGDIHYIFGNAAAVFDRSEIHSNGPGVIASQSRTEAGQATGYVFLNSKVTGAGGAIGLGDPWRAYSRTVFIRTSLAGEVSPEGWSDRGNAANRATAYYGEWENTGPGAGMAARVPWAHRLSADEARAYFPTVFLRGSDNWNAPEEAKKLP